MNKKILIYSLILTIFIIFTYAFSQSYSFRGIDKLAYVIALGIDSSENSDLKITFQFTKTASTSQDDSSSESTTIENTIEASSIEEAINLMNVYMGKELNLSHCKIVVFSKDIAQKRNLYTNL